MTQETDDLSVLSQDSALALLKRTDLPPATLETLSKNSSLMKIRKVRLALVQHSKTPRHLVLRLLRDLFTFDLMQVALTPKIPTDIKVVAEETLIRRLEKLSLGEKLSLARRASGRVASLLLHDADAKVVEMALENSHLTEAAVVKELIQRDVRELLIVAVRIHPKWSLRTEVRAVLDQKDSGYPHVGTAAPGCPAEPRPAERESLKLPSSESAE